MDDWLWLEAGGLAVALDPATGAIRQVRLLASGIDLTDASVASTPAWRLELTDGRLLTCGVRPRITTEDDGSVTLEWRDGATLVAARIEPGPDGLRVRARVSRRRGAARPRVLEYPIIGRLRRTDPQGGDWLLHPFATGLLVHDPLLTLDPEGATGPLAAGFVHAPYPEGFSGATMQFMALGGPQGGLYLGAEDPAGQPKWLDAYLASDGLLELRVGHANPNYAAPTVAWTPPVALSGLGGNGWWEAAQRYRRWALDQPWCARGPLEGDPTRPRWLFEQVGLVTFGIDAAVDRSRWLRATHEAAGASVLHILGPDWARSGQDYVSHVPGSLADWLPARIDPNNLLAIQRQGDRLALFEFDLLVGLAGSDSDDRRAALQRLGQPIRSSDAYAFPFLCPTADFTRRLHRERDRRLARDPGVDAYYYDISANNILAECLATDHPHRPGGGPEIAAAHARLYRETRDAAEGEARRPLAMGAELINERLIGELDFYQARAGAAPAASFETDRLYERVVDGSVELVPLFAAVYHEFGPVRTDGWAKLSAEQGDLVFWNLARVVAWGGLPQVNAEYSPLESLPGHPAPLTDHYFPLRGEHAFEADPEVMRFLGELSVLRTHLATRFLAYGTMLSPPPVDCEVIELSWFHYNGPPGSPAYDRRGAKRVPAVVAGAWRHRGDVAVVLVNADRQPRRAALTWTSALLAPEDARDLVIRDRHAAVKAGRIVPGTTTSITIEPRTAVVLEASASSKDQS